MLRFFAQRLSQAVIVMMVVACIAFALCRYAGDPINNLVGQDTSEVERDALRRKLGFDRSVFVQFARYVGAVIDGDFGTSYRYRRPVKELIAERLAATLELVFVASLLALAVGIPAGVYTAVHRDGVVSRVLMIISLFGVSLPTFLLGLLLILLFGVVLRWLPTYGRGEVVEIGCWSTGLLTLSGIKALIMPSLTLASYQATLVMRLVRAGMLDVLQSDFIKFARARGLSPRSIQYSHALGNALLPVCTIIGLQFGTLIAFAVVTEQVFQWPGLGLLFIQAVNQVDIPLITAYLVLVSLMFVSINLIVDMLYYVVDPRLRVDNASLPGSDR